MKVRIEEKILNILEPSLKELGFEVISLRYYKEGKMILQITIDRIDGKVSVSDCQKVSKYVSVLLNVENIILDDYLLEITSAGIERELTKINDYEKFKGNTIKIYLNQLILGRKNFLGKLKGLWKELILLELPLFTLMLPIYTVQKAHIVLTDDMYKHLLNNKF